MTSERLHELEVTLDYDDIFLHLQYGGVWFRFVCEDNPSDGIYIDEEDLHKLLNCVLTATIARQNTVPFAGNFIKWKKAMANFISLLENAAYASVNPESKTMKHFINQIEKAKTYLDIRPNN